MPRASRIPQLSAHREAALDPEMRARFATMREKLGFVPHVFTALGRKPEQLRRFIDHHDTLMVGDSPLTRLEREMIAVVVSSANRCAYCLASHGAAVRRLSEDHELAEFLVMDYRAASVSPRQRVMLDFAWNLTVSPHLAGDSRDALERAGFSGSAIYDICQVAAFFNYTNRLAHGLDILPNEQFHGMFRDGSAAPVRALSGNGRRRPRIATTTVAPVRAPSENGRRRPRIATTTVAPVRAPSENGRRRPRIATTTVAPVRAPSENGRRRPRIATTTVAPVRAPSENGRRRPRIATTTVAPVRAPSGNGRRRPRIATTTVAPVRAPSGNGRRRPRIATTTVAPVRAPSGNGRRRPRIATTTVAPVRAPSGNGRRRPRVSLGTGPIAPMRTDDKHALLGYAAAIRRDARFPGQASKSEQIRFMGQYLLRGNGRPYFAAVAEGLDLRPQHVRNVLATAAGEL